MCPNVLKGPLFMFFPRAQTYTIAPLTVTNEKATYTHVHNVHIITLHLKSRVFPNLTVFFVDRVYVKCTWKKGCVRGDFRCVRGHFVKKK